MVTFDYMHLFYGNMKVQGDELEDALVGCALLRLFFNRYAQTPIGELFHSFPLGARSNLYTYLHANSYLLTTSDFRILSNCCRRDVRSNCWGVEVPAVVWIK